ncbi:MAG: DUF2029 domain-containing protein [Chloroflexi bacterium]|nr:DUF2029 domain-containing protein [Chloroflexota bacterium]MBI3734657.1 DUF2029 domain-containing protein [Chloroflexota bacterium]
MPRSVLAQAILIAVFVAALTGLVAAGLYFGYTHVFASANDFYIPWRATRELVFNGRDPYSEAVARDIQLQLFGAVRAAGEHQYTFAYPLYVSLLLAPFTLLPYDAAQALWQSVLLMIVLAAVPLVANESRAKYLLPAVLFTLLFYPTARGLILGQMAVAAFGAVVLARWGLMQGHDRIAGAALALALVKPQESYLVVALVLVWAVARRRTQLLVAFSAVIGICLLASWLWMPEWPRAFLTGAAAYAAYVGVGSPVQVASTLFGSLADPLAWAVTLALLMWLAVTLWREARTGWPQFERLLMLTLMISQLIAIGTATTNQIVLLLPLFWLVRAMLSRALKLAALSAFLVAPWVVFAATLVGKDEQPIAFVPVTVGLLLLWLSQPLWQTRQRESEVA